MTRVVKTEEWIDPESQHRFRTVDAYIRAARVFTGRSTDHTRAGDANAAQADTIAILRHALSHHVAMETDPCRWDHNGNCQNHGSFNYDSTCQVAEHRALLGLDGDA